MTDTTVNIKDTPTTVSTKLNRLTRSRFSAIAEGILAGWVGAFVVAVFFAIANLAAGLNPLETVAVLGTAIFEGPAMVQAGNVLYDPSTILGYTAIHFAVFIMFGVIAAFIGRMVAKRPSLGAASILLIAVVVTPFVASTFLMGWVTGQALHGTWVAAANVIAVFAVFGTLAFRSKRVRRQITDGQWMRIKSGELRAEPETP